MKKTILITGGTGFVGSHLVEQLVLSHSAETIHVTTHSGTPSFVSNLLPAENIHVVNLLDAEATLAIFSTTAPTELYHLASIAHAGKSFAEGKSIVLYIALQLNVLEAVRQVSANLPCRTLCISSAQVYDPMLSDSASIDEAQPLGSNNPYGVSKISQDLLSQSYVYAHQLPIIRVRPFNHLGERQNKGFLVADMASQIVALEKQGGGTLSVGNLSPIRDFSDVKDVVSAYQLLMESGVVGDVYNAGSGVGTRVSTIVEMLLASSSSPITMSADPTRQRASDTPQLVCNPSKLKSLGWSPTHPLEETLKRVLQYWRTIL